MLNFNIRFLNIEELREFSRIKQNAYPNFHLGTESELEERFERLKNLYDNNDINFLGYYEENKLKGCLIFFYFDFNFHGKMIKAGGIGSLAVDLLYKKEKIAQKLINYSLSYAKTNNMPMLMLYPFNAKFYRNFGFGYGKQINLYQIKPEHFKNFIDKSMLKYINIDDVDGIIECYNHMVEIKHGMMKKTSIETFNIKNASKIKTIVFKKNNIKGYIRFTFEKINDFNRLSQKIIIREMIYDSPEVLRQFSTFFHSLRDQVQYIELTTFDDSLYYLLEDVCYYTDQKLMPIVHHKTNDCGTGLMYKAIDVDRLLALINKNLDYNIKFEIKENRDNKVNNYFLGNKEEINCVISISINDFSSWIVGSVKLNSLYKLGLIKTNNVELLKKIDYKLNFDEPECWTSF